MLDELKKGISKKERFQICDGAFLWKKLTVTGGNTSQSCDLSLSLGFVSLGSQTSKLKKYIYDRNKTKKLKLNEKTKKREDKEKEVNTYKSTFNTINNIIFIAIICFDWREQLLYILLRSLYFIIALTRLLQRFWFDFLIYCDSTFSFHLLVFLFHNSIVTWICIMNFFLNVI